MPRTVFVTMGEFAGRYMRMEDDVAAKALADGWARENETEPEADPDNPNPVEDLTEEVPESLIEYENPVEPENEDQSEPEEDDEVAPKKRKYTRKHHSR